MAQNETPNDVMKLLMESILGKSKQNLVHLCVENDMISSENKKEIFSLSAQVNGLIQLGPRYGSGGLWVADCVGRVLLSLNMST